MRIFRRLAGAALVLAAAGLWPTFAQAQPSERWDLCVEQYWANQTSGQQALGISASEAETLIRDIASRIGLRADSIIIIPCHRVSRAYAFYTGGTIPRVRAGEYMFYNETWVSEVIGRDRIQAVALFGHELGHLLNRDFLEPRSASARFQLEADADEFAGCAVAVSEGDWASVEDLFSRLRGEAEGAYPNRLQSLEVARRGFDRCARERRDLGQIPSRVARIVDSARAVAAEADEIGRRALAIEVEARRHNRRAQNNEAGYQVVRYTDGSMYGGQPRTPGSSATGVFRRTDGDEYAGAFATDQTSSWYAGLGVYTYGTEHDDGVAKHVGEFEGNRLSGHGEILYSSLSAPHFAAAFAAGERVWNPGSVARYRGGVDNDHPQGLGVMTFLDGTQLIGEWRGGVLSGFGLELGADGRVIRAGYWFNGVFRQ